MAGVGGGGGGFPLHVRMPNESCLKKLSSDKEFEQICKVFVTSKCFYSSNEVTLFAGGNSMQIQ
jgi:hypothetical protein